MNAYEQLQTIREELEDREAGPETLRLVDRAITLAEREKDNPLSISQSMMLRHLLKMPEAANNHYIQMDLEALQGDIADRRARRLPVLVMPPAALGQSGERGVSPEELPPGALAAVGDSLFSFVAFLFRPAPSLLVEGWRRLSVM